MKQEFKTSEDLCRAMRERIGPEVLLSFSLGKDSLAAFLQLRKFFDRVECFYLWKVPGLDLVQEGIELHERQLGIHIRQYPHPTFYRMLRDMVFQPPEMARYWDFAGDLMPGREYTLDAITDIVRREAGIPGGWCCTGERAVDNLMRRMHFQTHGPVNEKRKYFYPVFDWPKARMLEEFNAAGVHLPPDYRLFGCSFEWVGAKFMGPIKEHYPQDYARILEWFPLADLDLFRRTI